MCRDQSLHNGLFLLGIISEDMLSRVDRHKLEIKLDSARLICQVRPSAAAYSPSPRLYWRPTTPHIDFTVLRAWLNLCHLKHGSNCYTGGVKLSPHLKVINCETLTVVFASPGCSYAALSYVWGTRHAGTRFDDSYSSFEAGGGARETKLPENLPRVIRDAVTVAKALGTKYLWVDKYCINQRDVSITYQQLQAMGQTYKNARFTIIAVAGEDEDFGLPGVSLLSSASKVQIWQYSRKFNLLSCRQSGPVVHGHIKKCFSRIGDLSLPQIKYIFNVTIITLVKERGCLTLRHYCRC